MKSNPKTLLITAKDEKQLFDRNISDAISVVEYAINCKNKGNVFLPEKIPHIFDESTQSRINCMPGALLSDNLYGVKWIAVFPNNPQEGYRNVTGTTILSELEHGHTLAIMDSGYLTDIRTAAVSATAVKYLARNNVESIGFIGAGQQARRHLDTILTVRPNLKKCYVSSRTVTTVEQFIAEECALHQGLEFINCRNDFEASTVNADIIITATSAQTDLLKAKWIKQGALYIHVAGWEDEYAVAKMADKIVCDEWESIKHRTQTISKMYREGLLKDDDIHGNLEQILNGEIKGRESDKEFIYFCSVGLAYIDIAFAKYVYERCKEQKLGKLFSFS